MNIDGFALVVGAGNGIGLECALAYAASGAAGVAFADINAAAVENWGRKSKELAAHPQYQFLALHVDISEEASVGSMVEIVRKKFGRIDYAVNSAGIGVKVPAEISEANLEEFDKFININTRGTFLFTRAVTQVMKAQSTRAIQGRNGLRDLGRGVIVNIGSCNSYVPVGGIIQYTTSKHAVMGIVKSAAIDNATYGIRVNAVCPSWVKSPMMDSAMEGSLELREMIEKAIPMSRVALPEEVSDMVLFLSGPGGSYITGVGYIIDGGTTLQMHT